MKRKTVFLFLLSMLLMWTGCAQSAENGNVTEETSGMESTVEPATEEPEPTESEKQLALLSFPTGEGTVGALQVDLYVCGEAGYAGFRIPSLCVAPNGTLLAFAEGRVGDMDDWGDIDLVVKRSTDNGRTWSELEMIWDYGAESVSNPTVVTDRTNGRIWLFAVLNSEAEADRARDGVYCKYSDDNGATWSEERLILNERNWPGPGNGIQLLYGEEAGRLIIPCRNFVLFSDDHGETWKKSASNNSGGETTIVELPDGTLMRNDRGTSDGLRRISYSTSGGMFWQNYQNHPLLIESNNNGCQASQICFYRFEEDGTLTQSLIFCNPAHPTRRVNLTVRVSEDNGETYPYALLIDYLTSAYSALAQLGTDHVALLYEQGNSFTEQAKIVFRVLTYQELLVQADNHGLEG